MQSLNESNESLVGALLNSFELKLLTASRDVGLRRLRSYSASLGGGAQIFNSYDELLDHLKHAPSLAQNVIIHDNSIFLTSAQLGELRQRGRLFVMQKLADGQPPPPAPTGDCSAWSVESYLQCSLATFLESTLIRMSMAQMCKSDAPFHLRNLLRWGHIDKQWLSTDRQTLPEAGLAFIKNLQLVGENRRLTEIFIHFTETRLGTFNLVRDRVYLGTDGLLTIAIATCRPKTTLKDNDLSALAAELRLHNFHTAAINRLANGLLEVAAMYYPFQSLAEKGERVILYFAKQAVQAQSEEEEKAVLLERAVS